MINNILKPILIGTTMALGLIAMSAVLETQLPAAGSSGFTTTKSNPNPSFAPGVKDTIKFAMANKRYSITENSPDHVIGGLNYKPADEEAIKNSILKGNKVVLLFSADWCIPCKVFKAGTLSDPSVVDALKGADLYYADCTASNSPGWPWLRKLGGSGVPYFVMFKDAGKHISTRDGKAIKKFLKSA